RLGAVSEDFGDADHRKLVPVTTLAARILAPALLEGDDLVAAGVLQHLAGNHRRADLRYVAADHQDLAELDDFPRLTVDAVDPDNVFGGNPVLFAARFNDCEHHSSLRVRSRRSEPPDRLLSVGFAFVFRGLSPIKSRAEPFRPRDGHAYG